MQASTELVSAAAASELVRRVGVLVDWLGQGRKLTQTGQVTLGDARELVELLGTGDEIDQRIGDRVFRTTSSRELYGLTLVVAWAKAARVVRVSKGRLLPVKRNLSLRDRPLELVARLWEVFGELGTVVCREGWFESPLRYEFDTGLAAITSALRGAAGPVPLAGISAAVWEEVSRYFVLDHATESQRDNLRKSNDRDVRSTLEVLGLLGLVRVADAEVALTPLGRRIVRGSLDAAPGEPMLQVRLTLLEVEPLVWRRFVVPAGIRLDQLHRVVQAVMGWTDSHLHWFTVGDQRWGVPDPDWPEPAVHDEQTAALRELAALDGGRFGYTYDFGDDWRHELVVEKQLTADDDQLYPACVDGAGACPPEDCGGAPGYEHLRRVIADPAADEHEELLGWLGLAGPAEFDPARFDPADANRALAAL